MPIEVRQLVIRSQVAPPDAPAAASADPAALPAALRAEILAECRAMIDERLRQRRER